MPAYENFEGNFTPASASTKLAIFSDDVCDVFVDGAKVYGGKGQGQALPNLAQSLHKISFTFVAGQSYLIRVEYSNTSYQGAAGIDGATLFAYTDTGEPSLLLTSNRNAICAGGWDDGRGDYVYLEKETGAIVPRSSTNDPHIATLTATLNDSEGHAMADKKVTFTWDMPGPAPADTPTRHALAAVPGHATYAMFTTPQGLELRDWRHNRTLRRWPTLTKPGRLLWSPDLKMFSFQRNSVVQFWKFDPKWLK